MACDSAALTLPNYSTMIVKSLAAGLAAGASLLLAFIGGGYQIVGPTLLHIQMILASITLWDALQIVSTVVVPFLVLFLTGLGKLVWAMHGRLKRIEASQDQHSKTLYGDDADVMHEGLSQEMSDLKLKVSNIEQMLGKISRQIEEADNDDNSD